MLRLHSLSAREREIAIFAALGYTSAQIGERAGITPQTVKNHLRSIFRILGVHGRDSLEPIVYAEVPEVRAEMERLGRAPKPFVLDMRSAWEPQIEMDRRNP